MRFAVLLGAIASFGAGAIVPHPPPLGANVYSTLRTEYSATWGTLDGDIDESFRGDFEVAMHNLWERQSEGLAAASFLIDMTRYFARFEAPPDQSDLYSQFVGFLIRSGLVGRTGIATLNYECILECAARQQNLPLAYNGADPPPGNLLIWKLQGSCNLFPQIEMRDITVFAPNIYEGPLRWPLSPAEVRAKHEERYSLPPAMSLFAPGKPTPVAASFIEAARREWADWVRRASFVAVIGARPLLADSHVWDPIIEADAAISYIGGRADFEVLAGAARSTVTHLAERFDDGYNALCRKLTILA